MADNRRQQDIEDLAEICAAVHELDDDHVTVLVDNMDAIFGLIEVSSSGAYVPGTLSLRVLAVYFVRLTEGDLRFVKQFALSLSQMLGAALSSERTAQTARVLAAFDKWKDPKFCLEFLEKLQKPTREGYEDLSEAELDGVLDEWEAAEELAERGSDRKFDA